MTEEASPEEEQKPTSGEIIEEIVGLRVEKDKLLLYDDEDKVFPNITALIDKRIAELKASIPV